MIGFAVIAVKGSGKDDAFQGRLPGYNQFGRVPVFGSRVSLSLCKVKVWNKVLVMVRLRYDQFFLFNHGQDTKYNILFAIPQVKLGAIKKKHPAFVL